MDQLKIHLFSKLLAVQVQVAVRRYQGCSEAENMLSAANIQSRDPAYARNLCGSLRDAPLSLRLLGTAGWVKAEISSSSQGYARLQPSRSAPASARVRKRGAGALGRE